MDSGGPKKACIKSEGAILGKDHARACPTTLAVSCAKMAEPVVMPFELWILVGPRKHVVDGGVQIPHAKEQFLEERTCPCMPDDTLSEPGVTQCEFSFTSSFFNYV